MLRDVELESLAPLRCTLKSHRGVILYEEDNELAYRTSVVLQRCPLVSATMYEWVLLHYKPIQKSFLNAKIQLPSLCILDLA